LFIKSPMDNKFKLISAHTETLRNYDLLAILPPTNANLWEENKAIFPLYKLVGRSYIKTSHSIFIIKVGRLSRILHFKTSSLIYNNFGSFSFSIV